MSYPSSRYAAPSSPAADDLRVETIKVPGPIQIAVDHREPDLIVSHLRRCAQASVTVEALPLGDYALNGGRILVERKTVADFQASVIDEEKRLFVQSERLKLEPETIAVLILEGDVMRRAPRMSEQAFIGALGFIGVIQNLTILQSRDEQATAYQIVKLAQMAEHGLGYELALRVKKPKALLSGQRYLLEGLPGVSGNLAERLLQHFGSVARVATASVADLCAVDGIGKSKAEAIHAVMQQPAGQGR